MKSFGLMASFDCVLDYKAGHLDAFWTKREFANKMMFLMLDYCFTAFLVYLARCDLRDI